jgi:hypothetical protein
VLELQGKCWSIKEGFGGVVVVVGERKDRKR